MYISVRLKNRKAGSKNSEAVSKQLSIWNKVQIWEEVLKFKKQNQMEADT